jgi:hypothetical protein
MFFQGQMDFFYVMLYTGMWKPPFKYMYSNVFVMFTLRLIYIEDRYIILLFNWIYFCGILNTEFLCSMNNIKSCLYSSVLGPEVVGIWPRNADKADVNTACVTHNSNAIATGDDFGQVKLFDFPTTSQDVSHVFVTSFLTFHITLNKFKWEC